MKKLNQNTVKESGLNAESIPSKQEEEITIMIKYCLVIIWDDVEPGLMGPYETPEERDEAAREFRETKGEEHGIYPLTITGNVKKIEINSYSGGDFVVFAFKEEE